MSKNKIQSMSNNELIFDYIRFYAKLVLVMNTSHRGTKTTEKYLSELDNEMLKRGLLTKEQIEILNN